jgi:hypothetical protein
MSFIAYQGFLGSSFSDYLLPGQVDSFSVYLTAGYTYFLDVTSETTPLTISVGSTVQILGPYSYILTGGSVWFKPSSSGIYGVGIDTTSGGAGYYSISTHYTYTPPAPPPPAPPPPAPPPPALISTVLHGASTQYIIADNNGSLYIQDTVAGRDGARTLPGVGQMIFTDGTAVFDHSGAAEQLSRLYHATLDRAPDMAGITFWIDQIEHAHVPLNVIANTFATSPEFIRHYGALADTGFVSQLYQNVLGRPVDADGLKYWSSVLASGTSRGHVTLSVAECREQDAYRRHCWRYQRCRSHSALSGGIAPPARAVRSRFLVRRVGARKHPGPGGCIDHDLPRVQPSLRKHEQCRLRVYAIPERPSPGGRPRWDAVLDRRHAARHEP